MIEEKHVVAVLASALRDEEIVELIPPSLFEFCLGRGLIHDLGIGPRLTPEGRRWLQAVLR